uniref:Uncharacterized protein n=1 Tax=Klebsiella pneumoniae TaxID=573 RepID=D4HQP0_KLEPN|nr:hypothetical protein pKF140-002 [Klebsiella pneumoniae]
MTFLITFIYMRKYMLILICYNISFINATLITQRSVITSE